MDDDVEDEAQDYRFLTLPKRGDKDFEPDPTRRQAANLQVSRQAMHDAFSYVRSHHPNSVITAIWRPERNMAEVRHARGVHFRALGRVDREGVTWLLTEEALFLVERGTLDCRWVVEGTEERTLSMSLQGAWAAMLGVDGLSMERFQVYAQLKRGGFIVVRAPGWSSEVGNASIEGLVKPYRPRSPPPTIAQFLLWLLGRSQQLDAAHLANSRYYRSYSAVYRDLALIPFHDPRTIISPTSQRPDKPALTVLSNPVAASVSARPPKHSVTFHVYKSTPSFRKSNPGPPDYQICVISASEHPTVPTRDELSELMASVSQTPQSSEAAFRSAELHWTDPPSDKRTVFKRIRTGYRDVILAIVDSGVVSFLRVGEALMGASPLYEFNEPSNRNGKRQRGGQVKGGSRGRGQSTKRGAG